MSKVVIRDRKSMSQCMATGQPLFQSIPLSMAFDLKIYRKVRPDCEQDASKFADISSYNVYNTYWNLISRNLAKISLVKLVVEFRTHASKLWLLNSHVQFCIVLKHFALGLCSVKRSSALIAGSGNTCFEAWSQDINFVYVGVEEWRVRVDLAAAYRQCYRQGLCEGEAQSPLLYPRPYIDLQDLPQKICPGLGLKENPHSFLNYAYCHSQCWLVRNCVSSHNNLYVIIKMFIRYLVAPVLLGLKNWLNCLLLFL